MNSKRLLTPYFLSISFVIVAVCFVCCCGRFLSFLYHFRLLYWSGAIKEVAFRPDIYEWGPQRTLWAGVGSWSYIKHRLSNDKDSPNILCRTRKDKQHTSRHLTIKVFPIKESPFNIKCRSWKDMNKQRIWSPNYQTIEVFPMRDRPWQHIT